MSKFGPPTVYFVFGAAKKVDVDDNSFWAFFAAEMFTTLFCLYWDFVMDWGFFRGTKKENWILRDKMIFSKKFYYTCMFFNTLFRFWWIISIFSITYHSILIDQVGILLFAAMFVEIIRRTFWGIIRVENEFFNNFEKYRDVVMIPPIREENLDE